MNILEVTPQLRRGAGTVVTKLSESLVQRGHKLTVVTSGDVDDLLEWPELHKKLEELSIKHHYISVFKRESYLVWEAVEQMAQLLEENPFDIVHVHSGVPAFIVKNAMKRIDRHIPILATFHSWGATRPHWMNIADTVALNECDEIVYDSFEYIQIAKGFGVRKTEKVIYPFVTVDQLKLTNELDSYKEKFRIPKDAKIITHLGEVTDKKGQLDLIKVLKEVRQTFDAYVILVGQCRDEAYLAEINQYLKENNLEKYVIMTGWVDDALSIIKGSDAFVFPSYSEGLGMAIVEAALCGVPVTFTYHEGMKDIADILGDKGFGTFALGNINEMAERTLSILNMDSSIKSNKIKQINNILLEKFSLEKMVTEYEELMNKMISIKE